LILLL